MRLGDAASTGFLDDVLAQTAPALLRAVAALGAAVAFSGVLWVVAGSGQPEPVYVLAAVVAVLPWIRIGSARQRILLASAGVWAIAASAIPDTDPRNVAPLLAMTIACLVLGLYGRLPTALVAVAFSAAIVLWQQGMAGLVTALIFLLGVGGLVLSMRQVADALMRLVDRMAHEATHDGLTDLPTREVFTSAMQRRIDTMDSAVDRLAVIVVDIDDFKRINDMFGHYAGDLFLVEASARIQRAMRESDSIGRLAGDEFGICLTDIATVASTGNIAALAGRINRLFVEPILVHGMSIDTTVSIGISLYPEDGKGAEALLKNAGMAMSDAKASGPGRFRFFSDVMTDRAYDRMIIENGLREAIQNDRLAIEYQPKVDGNGRLVGMEALVRWPLGGHYASPGVFIPIAEGSGLILALGEWVVQMVCRHISQWRRSGLSCPPVAINVSPMQLRSAEFAGRLIAIMREHGLDGGAVEVEITETDDMDAHEFSSDFFSAMQAAGIPLAIDDFGTGYSSFSRLKSSRFSSVKIDKSIIDDVHSCPNASSIVANMIRMIHKLGLKAVAEGVEHEDQFVALRGMGCDQIQGHWVSMPLPADFIPDVLHKDYLVPLIFPDAPTPVFS